MKKSDITYILCCVFAATTSFFYCCTRWFSIIGENLPRYYPTEHTWKFAKGSGISQGWYGMQGFAFVCAGIVTFIVYLLLKGSTGKEQDSGLSKIKCFCFGAGATLMMVIAMGYIVYYEFKKWGILQQL